jgi:hypothetical protein
MEKLTKVIHNVETGEVTQREFNSDELAQFQTDQAGAQAKAAEAEAKATAKAALLDRLGITADEAKLLLS